MEQVVALVLSVLPVQIAVTLVIYVKHLILDTSMWLEYPKDSPSYLTQEESNLLKKILKVRWNLENTSGVMKNFDVYEKQIQDLNQFLLNDFNTFIEQIKNVRRRNDKLGNSQRLYIPNILEEVTNGNISASEY